VAGGSGKSGALLSGPHAALAPLAPLAPLCAGRVRPSCGQSRGRGVAATSQRGSGRLACQDFWFTAEGLRNLGPVGWCQSALWKVAVMQLRPVPVWQLCSIFHMGKQAPTLAR